jgi:transcriptional regulator with XRE-family HTH domain
MTSHQIAATRIANGWTQAQLADICGVGATAVSNWEAGIRQPSKAAMKLLAIELAKTQQAKEAKE